MNYILNDLEIELKNTTFVCKVFQHNQSLNQRIWIVEYIQTDF